MSVIQANPVARGASLAGGLHDETRAAPSRNAYTHILIASQTYHQRLAEEWRAASEASGVLDLMRDDPLPFRPKPNDDQFFMFTYRKMDKPVDTSTCSCYTTRTNVLE